MDKTRDKDEWKEVGQHASKVAKKQWAAFQSRLTKESRRSIHHMEAAAVVEARRVTVSILKLVAELDVNAKQTIKTILADLEKEGTKKKPSIAKKTAKSVKRQSRKKKARKTK